MIFKYGCHNHSRSVMLAGPRLAPLRMRGSLPMTLSGGCDMHMCVCVCVCSCVFMFVPRLCVACRLWLGMQIAWNYITRILILPQATSVTYPGVTTALPLGQVPCLNSLALLLSAHWSVQYIQHDCLKEAQTIQQTFWWPRCGPKEFVARFGCLGRHFVCIVYPGSLFRATGAT